jgi:hypoxanthine-DNA glycosylase
VAAPDARVLILGSLPGAMSLAMRQYYAQPRNGFWRIMAEIAGAGPEVAYADRLDRLRQARIALWDVCEAAERPGSLDASIVLASVTPNRFGAFLGRHSGIGAICFNGNTAARLFERLAVSKLSMAQAALPRTVLPSTSPAHAGMPFEGKLRRWREVLLPLIR